MADNSKFMNPTYQIYPMDKGSIDARTLEILREKAKLASYAMHGLGLSVNELRTMLGNNHGWDFKAAGPPMDPQYVLRLRLRQWYGSSS